MTQESTPEPEEVYGRVLGGKGIGYERARALLRPGEELYAVHDQGIKTVSVPLPDREAWEYTDAQYGSGLSLDYVFAAVPEAGEGQEARDG